MLSQTKTSSHHDTIDLPILICFAARRVASNRPDCVYPLVFPSKLVLEDEDWIPEGDGYSLYLRPTAISTHVSVYHERDSRKR